MDGKPYLGQQYICSTELQHKAWTTPYEVCHNKKPSVHHLRTFGCVAYIKENKPYLAKLDARARKVVFIGYEVGSKAYRVFDPVNNKVHVSRDIVFDENVFWQWDAVGHEELVEHPFTVEYLVREPEQATVDEHSDARSAGPQEEQGTPSPGVTPDPALVVFATPPTVDENHDANEGAQLRYRRIEDLLGNGRVQVVAGHDIDQLHAISVEEPATFAEAEQDECWHQAMREEISSILDNKTWSPEDLPRGHKALKWVYKLKRKEEGEVVKHKARLVANEYVQSQGVDFEEVFAPVARLESVRMLLAITEHFGWKVHHMDVKSAFPNGVIKEIVYAVATRICGSKQYWQGTLSSQGTVWITVSSSSLEH
jgi:hypothetical protein